MSLSNSHLSYADCYDVMDAALEQPRGVRVSAESLDRARFFNMRMNQARSIDRKRNLETYNEGDPLYGASQYDKLLVRIREEDDKVWLYVEIIDSAKLEVEPLAPWESLPVPQRNLELTAEPPQIEEHKPLLIEHRPRRPV